MLLCACYLVVSDSRHLCAIHCIPQACTLLRGVFGAMSLTCYYASVEMLPIKVAVTLFFCNPAIAVILELLVRIPSAVTSAEQTLDHQFTGMSTGKFTVRGRLP